MTEDAVPRALTDAGLTPREREVFWLVSDRLRNREIAERLYISERTVESHVASLLRKLHGSDRRDLITLGTDLRQALGSERELPQFLSSFVGRTSETSELPNVLLIHRLVTLTGPAGVGKTRLAYHVARSMTDMPPPILVDLATVTEPDEVARAFASTLGLLEDDHGLRDALRTALRDGRHWLVVDNCEHVRSAVASLLGELLSAAGGLSVLATSRSPLGIAGEVVYEISPLPVPADSDDPASVLAEPAARLFADRAATASPGFEVTAQNAQAVSALCRRLDGLPLAIELAAARIRTFSPSELESRLDQRFAVLDAGPLDGAARHRTLEAALEWSYDLLDEDERLVFERCSVFPGEFDYDTAAAVLALPPLRSDTVARAFPRLLDRSLVSRRRLGDQTTVYRMLETFRDFARDRLVEHGHAEAIARRHAEHHIEEAKGRAAALKGSGQLVALRWFERRWTDLRAAMRWALTQGEHERAWQLLTRIGRNWAVIGIRGELFDWLHELLDRPLPAGELGTHARLTAAFLLTYTDARHAVRLADEARELIPPTEHHTRAVADLTLGWALGYTGNRSAAIEHLEPALAQFRQLHDPFREALARQGLGHAAQDTDTLIEHLEQAALLFGRLNNDVLQTNCLTMLAARALEMNVDAALIQDWLDKAQRLATQTGSTHERLHVELHRARLAQQHGDHNSAVQTLQELLPNLRRIGDQRCASRCLLGIGWGALTQGDHLAARQHLTASIALAHQLDDPRVMASSLRLLTRLELEDGNEQQAARLLGAASTAADRLDAARRSGLPDMQQTDKQLTTALGPDRFQSAFDEGRGTTLAGLLPFIREQSPARSKQ